MPDNLTPRELDVLRLAAQGLKNHEIAVRLGLAPKTIEHMLGKSDPYRAIYPKIGVESRAEAIAWYYNQYGGISAQEKKAADRLSEQLLEMYWEYANRAYALRMGGQPQLAREMASFLAAHTAQAAQDATTPRYRSAFLQAHATALVELGLTYLETTPPVEVLAQIRPVVGALEAVAHELDDAHWAATAYTTLAGAYNISKDYKMGRQLYSQAFAIAENPNLQLRILRGLGIAATYLQDKDGVAKVKQEAQGLIEEGRFTNLEQVCETTEGLARAQALMGVTGAETWFDSAERVLSVLNYPPLRQLQVLQSKFEVMWRVDPASAVEIERIGQEAIRLADLHGYPRHRALVMENLDKQLNRPPLRRKTSLQATAVPVKAARAE